MWADNQNVLLAVLMHVSQITELYSSSQFSESLILRQIFNFNGDSYLLAGKIRKGMDTLHFRVLNPHSLQLSEN